jgi:hypothetical protein
MDLLIAESRRSARTERDDSLFPSVRRTHEHAEQYRGHLVSTTADKSRLAGDARPVATPWQTKLTPRKWLAADHKGVVRSNDPFLVVS